MKTIIILSAAFALFIGAGMASGLEGWKADQSDFALEVRSQMRSGIENRNSLINLLIETLLLEERLTSGDRDKLKLLKKDMEPLSGMIDNLGEILKRKPKDARELSQMISEFDSQYDEIDSKLRSIFSECKRINSETEKNEFRKRIRPKNKFDI